MTINKVTVSFALFLSLLIITLMFTGCSSDSNQTVTVTMDVEPLSMYRETIIDSNPEAQKVRVINSNNQDITFSATAQESWIRLALYGGGAVVDRPAPDSFVISIASRTLSSGFYLDTVWVTSPEATNSPVGIEVTLLVGDNLVVTPDSIGFNAITFRGNPQSQSININSIGGVGVDYSMTKKSSWLNLSNTTGTVPDDIDLSASTIGLTPGYYYDTITIDAPLAVNSPLYIPCTLSVFSWEEKNHPYVDNTTLDAIFFIDDLHGWATGSVDNFIKTGYIIATDDGGENWVVQELSIENIVGDVIFLDQDTGYVSGEKGLIRKTTDGGDNWITKITPRTSDLLSISFTDYNNGWACGDDGTILHTSDAGETWELQSSNVAYDLNAVQFINPDSGWVVGNGGTVLFTSDGGETWVFQTPPVSTDLRDVYFANSSEGWAVGLFGTIQHTTNSGNTWDILSTGIDTEYRGISFCICGQGWIVGNNGSILYSADGITWVEQLSGTDVILKDVFMITNNKGWVVGHEGMILYTEVGGH